MEINNIMDRQSSKRNTVVAALQSKMGWGILCRLHSKLSYDYDP